jgi:hypothetical protein
MRIAWPLSDFQKEVPAVPQFSDNMQAQRRAGAAKLAS